MIFTIGDIVILFVVVAVLIAYRQIDRNNRSLDKIKRYTDKVSDDLEKLVPQPQVEVALGFSTAKRAPISSSLKSITEPERKGRDSGSISTRCPAPSITRSPAAASSSSY